MNLIKWTWYGREVHSAYLYLIHNKMKRGDFYLVKIEENGSRVWTQSKAKALTFENVKKVREFIGQYFTAEQQATMSIIREG